MAENAFVNTNRFPKNNYQNNEEIVNQNRTANNPSSHNSNPSKSAAKERRTSKKQSKNPLRKLFRACAQCFGKKKAKIVKSKTSFVESIKEKARKCRTKKRRRKQRAAEKEKDKQEKEEKEEDKQEKKSEDTKKVKKKKHKGEHKKGEDVPSPVSTEPAVVTDHAKLPDQIYVAGGQDFTKSCCYLCATNAMAIAAAISGQKEKANVYIQTSVRFKERSDTTDKSCSPMMYVRTVQSSVKVRTRDMGTLHPEKKKKSKKTRPKLNFKRFSIIPRVKFTGYPRVRTVACETDKSMGHNNIPQCRARHGTHCVTENK